MRRVIAWILILCLALGCVGCKSKEERELENLQKASQRPKKLQKGLRRSTIGYSVNWMPMTAQWNR